MPFVDLQPLTCRDFFDFFDEEVRSFSKCLQRGLLYVLFLLCLRRALTSQTLETPGTQWQQCSSFVLQILGMEVEAMKNSFGGRS